MGVEALKDIYHEDSDFKDVYNVCEQHLNSFHSEFSDFLLQNGFLFKGSQHINAQ